MVVQYFGTYVRLLTIKLDLPVVDLQVKFDCVPSYLFKRTMGSKLESEWNPCNLFSHNVS